MGCGCNKNRKQWEVVTADNKVVYTTTSKSAATGVAQRYEGGIVREKQTESTS